MRRIPLISFVSLLLLSCGSGGGVGSGGAGGGGGGIGIDFPGGGANVGGDTPGLELPPGGFPDGGFAGGGSSTVALAVTGRTSTGGVRGTSDFTLGIGEGGLSEVQATITNANAVQFVAQAGGALMAGALLDPTDAPIVSLREPASGPQQTAAVFADRSINSLPYPTSSLDGAIVSGSEYRYQIVSAGAEIGGITGTVVAKNDPFLAGGTLRVKVYLVGIIAQSSDSRSAIAQAIQVWADAFAAAGINLDVSLEDVASGTGILPAPNVGSLFYATNAAASRPYTLHLYVGAGISKTSETSPGDTYSNEVLGIASSIPGPSIPTIRSAVAVNIIAHSGPDGLFSSNEIEVFGSTMAHEAGHYLGLFHTVEFAGDSDSIFVPGDLFPDTVPCFTTQECLNTGAAGNMMFPAAVTGQLTQTDLSLNQRQALNLQILVD